MCNIPISLGGKDGAGTAGVERKVRDGNLPQDIKLERSFTYLVKEKWSDRSFKILVKALKEGYKGFCITRSYPPHIKTKFDLGDTKIIWLSNMRMEGNLSPKDLEELAVMLDKFMSSVEKGIIHIDGIEYLITSNDFPTMLKFVQGLKDEVTLKNGVLVMSISPYALEPQKLKLLEEEADVVV